MEFFTYIKTKGVVFETTFFKKKNQKVSDAEGLGTPKK